ncbi:MAG: hypothetical protein JOY80_01465 [Candidatus Dormibacteraeota bacterium]|nr:hypothetical protein [Candidatus Dormibacteraeota bacterium]
MSSSAIEGFVGGWIMFHNVMPGAASTTRADLMRAAAALNLPLGTEVNGSGVRFAPQGTADAGDNTLATTVIWQWKTPQLRYIVYPQGFAEAPATLVPLAG